MSHIFDAVALAAGVALTPTPALRAPVVLGCMVDELAATLDDVCEAAEMMFEVTELVLDDVDAAIKLVAEVVDCSSFGFGLDVLSSFVLLVVDATG